MKFLDEVPLLLNSLGHLFGGGLNQTVFADPLPAPQSISWSFSNPAIVLANLTLASNLINDESTVDILARAFDRSVDAISSQTWSPPIDEFVDFQLTNSSLETAPVSEVHVSIKDSSADLQQGVDESFILEVLPEKIAIHSETVWGTLHALTTLEQLTLSKDGHVFIEHPVVIVDNPLYSYRGLMIDTSRNFYPISDLERQIDMLHLAKMNVFHWHLTDHQAWPIQVASYPQMTKDAYSSEEVYTIEDVKHLVQYAYERGVRVIPEIDMPGHSVAGWKQIDPSLVACKDAEWETAAVAPVPGQLEILDNKTYDVLKTIYNDISDLFHDDFFHVGFDELNVGCYKQSPLVNQWFADHPNYTMSDLVQYWVDHALPIFMNNDRRKLIMWQDALLSEHIPAKSIPESVVLQVWIGGSTTVAALADRGYDVIFSSADFLYLDCGFGQWTANDREVGDQVDPSPGTPSYNYGGSGGSWCGPYKSWQRIYNLDLSFGLTPAQQKHIIGGSAQLWSEQSGGMTADFMIWPRLAALAEVLWSGNLGQDGQLRNKEFTKRIFYFRERIVQRGASAAILAPKYCLKQPEACSMA